MTATITLKPATPEQEAAWRAARDQGEGYAPEHEIEAAYLAQRPNDGTLMATAGGRFVIGDVNGAWAVEVGEPQRYIVIPNDGGDHSTLPVDFGYEIEDAERALADLGVEQADVWTGEDGDAVKTGSRVFARG